VDGYRLWVSEGWKISAGDVVDEIEGMSCVAKGRGEGVIYDSPIRMRRDDANTARDDSDLPRDTVEADKRKACSDLLSSFGRFWRSTDGRSSLGTRSLIAITESRGCAQSRYVVRAE
jgi:hypothetical protein